MIIYQSAHLTPSPASNNDLANLDGAFLHKHGANRAAAPLQLRFNNNDF